MGKAQSENSSKPGRCSNLPEDVVTSIDCDVFQITNDLRTRPSSFLPSLEARRKDIETN